MNGMDPAAGITVTSISKTSQFFKRWSPAALAFLFLVPAAFNWVVFGPWGFGSINLFNPIILFTIAMDAWVIRALHGIVQDLRRLYKGEPLPEVIQNAGNHPDALGWTGAASAAIGTEPPFEAPQGARPPLAEEQPGVDALPATSVPTTGTVSAVLRTMQMQSANFLLWIVGLGISGCLLIGLTQGPSSGWNATARAGIPFFAVGIALGIWGLFITINVVLLDAVLSIVKNRRSPLPDPRAVERSASLRSRIIPRGEPAPNVFQVIFLLGETACVILLAIGVVLLALGHVV